MWRKVEGKRFKKKSKKDIILTVLIIFFTLVALICTGFYIYNTFILDVIDKSSVENLSKNIDVILAPDTNTEDDTDDGIVYSDSQPEIVRIGVDELDLNKIPFLEYDKDKLSTSSSDAVGWFKFTGPESVSGLPISNPLMQGSNNEYYLSHDYSGQENPNGAIYVDFNASMPNITSNKNTVIYGHARSKQKFGGLKYLNDAEAWYANAYNHFVYITTPTQKTVWQVFSWYETTADADYRKTYFSSDSDYVNYVNKLQNRNSISSLKKFNFSSTDKIITLSTCKGTDENKRVAVHAVLVKQG
ncbi:MAG: hypothetical protein DBX47_00135 [Clostridiales bacterium]|nr:MAG: hypothetical protein DBX47_00135 [Clostridiales bacterium]